MKKKILSYTPVLLIGLAIGLTIGLLINRGQQSPAHSNPSDWTLNNEIAKAVPDSIGAEAVNDEVIKLITDMYAAGDNMCIQKTIGKSGYPYKAPNKDEFDFLISLFDEYEWRANRTLGGFEASDINLVIEIYTLNTEQRLTLYGGYDLVYYTDEANDVAAYYTYLFSEDDRYADLAKRLQDFIDK